jgi:hypothetical protein
MDAGIMDGTSLLFGAVGAVSGSVHHCQKIHSVQQIDKEVALMDCIIIDVDTVLCKADYWAHFYSLPLWEMYKAVMWSRRTPSFLVEGAGAVMKFQLQLRPQVRHGNFIPTRAQKPHLVIDESAPCSWEQCCGAGADTSAEPELERYSEVLAPAPGQTKVVYKNHNSY